MTMLTDRDILHYIDMKWLGIEAHPLTDIKEKVRGCAVNLHLSNVFYRLKDFDPDTVDIYAKEFSDFLESFKAEEVVLEPGEAVCSRTIEDIRLPSNLAGLYRIRFRFSCFGLHSEGLIHPSSTGQQVLVIRNNGRKPFPLRHGKSVCHLLLFKTEHPSLDWYGEIPFKRIVAD